MATILCTVSQTNPLQVTIPGDLTASVPARNASGTTLTVGNTVRLTVYPKGRVPEVTGVLS